MNNVQIIGNLGNDPEVNYTRNDTAVCNLSVATNRTWYEGQDKKQETTWHNVVVWGDQAENCGQYLSKGRQVCVQGRIQKDEYTDNSGVERSSTEIVARRVHFLSGGESGGNGRGEPRRKPSKDNPSRNSGDDGQPDDIPF